MKELPWILSVASCVFLASAWMFEGAEAKRDLAICLTSVSTLDAMLHDAPREVELVETELAVLEARLEELRAR